MSEEVLTVAVNPPSRGRIIKATVIALAAAAVLLIVAILPAEYGIDPIGTGKALHLTDLAKADAARPANKPAGKLTEAAPPKAARTA